MFEECCPVILRKGQRIQGAKATYEILRVVHTGGIATIYYARVIDQDRWVAVKVPAQDQDPSVESRRAKRVAREGVTLRMVEHPGIVKLIEELEHGGTPVLVEEFVLGGRMLETFSGKPATPQEACQIICRLIEAVGALHQRGIIHRDICPKNIIMDPERGPVLVDFNICLYEHHDNCNRAGTEFWSAPEHLDRAFDVPEASCKSDVYSLAAVFRFLLTGREPDRYYRSQRDVKSVRSELFSLRVPSEMIDILCRALSFQPSARPSLGDMKRAICRKAVEPARLPTILIEGKAIELGSLTEIGREHRCSTCVDKMMVYVKDPFPYVEKHHVRLTKTRKGEVEMIVLPGKNTVAIRRRAAQSFQLAEPNVSITLYDGDIVALAYNRQKGPYKTFTVMR
jgi:serine/threonine protein kinase